MPFSMRNTARRAGLGALVLLAAGLVAACGGDDDQSAPTATSAATSTTTASADGPRSEHGQLIARATIPLDLADGTAIGRADGPRCGRSL